MMPKKLSAIFGAFPRSLAIWGYALPVLILLMIAVGAWRLTVPIVISAPIVITQHTAATDRPLIGTFQISAAEARQITLRQDAAVTVRPTPQARVQTVTGIVQTVRSAEQIAAAPVERSSYRRALPGRVNPGAPSGNSDPPVYTVTVIFPNGLWANLGQSRTVSQEIRGTVRIIIGQQRLLDRFRELFHRET